MTVNSIPKRRWLQFNLRTLLVATTLIGIVFARVSYLSRLAVFHEREAERLGRLLRQGDSGLIEFDNLISMIEHDSLAAMYRKADYRPWTTVDEEQAKVPEISTDEMGLTIDP